MNSMHLKDIKSIYKSYLHFYILIMNYQKGKIKKQLHFKLHKRIKYLGINLAKEMRYTYNESCKTLMNEIEDINK